MVLLTHFREAAINMWSAKLRSFLAILGVLVGTGSVVALISSSQLATAHALTQFKSLGTNLLSLNLRDQQSGQGGSTSQTQQFSLSDLPALIASSKQIIEVAPYTTLYQSAYFENINLQSQIIGAMDNFKVIAKVNLARGRFVSYLDGQNYFCVIGARVADQIAKTGVDPLGKQIRVGGTVFTVIGIMKSWPPNLFISADLNHSLVVPIQTSFFLAKNTHINNILIRLIQHPNITVAKQQVTQFLQGLLPQKQVAFSSPEQIIELIGKQRETYNLLLIAIGCISLIVGGIGVMNIMLVSVVERRREIGIRMALGARQKDILRMFLIESVLLTLCGGLLGVIVGTLTSFILAEFSGWQFYFYVLPVVLGFSISFLVGVFSGIYPAWRASQLNPIQALQS